MKKRSISLSFLFFILGVGLLIGLIDKVGPDKIQESLVSLGWGITLLMIFPLTWYCLQSLAWYRIIEDEHNGHVSLWHILLTKLTGEAINTVTPVSFMGGDPYRIYLLQKKISKTASTASVVIDRTMQSLAVVLLLFLTGILAILKLPLSPEMQIALPIITVALFALLVSLIAFQRKGVFRSLTNLALRIGIKRKKLIELEDKIEQLDDNIRRFYSRHKAHFFEILFLHFIGRLLGPVEIYIIAHLIGFPLEFINCLFLASLTILINMAFVFIPGSVGVMEGGYGALFYLLKLEPAVGVSIQLIRRIRAIFYVMIGLLIILFYKPKRNMVHLSKKEVCHDTR